MSLRLKFVLLALTLSLLVYWGCDVNRQNEYQEQLVLQGQMIVGYPPTVRLTHTVPIGEASEEYDVGVAGADVRMRIGTDSNSVDYRMTEYSSRGWPGYYTLNNGHRVTPGVHYAITVAVRGDTLRAETVAAGRMFLLYQNEDTVVCGSPTALVLRWRPDSLASGYYVLVDNMEFNYEDNPVDCNINPFATSSASNWSVSHRDDSLQVPWVMLRYRGRHEAIIFSCDRALWDYSYTAYYGQTENYPVSNVQGGLGLFSAVGVDTAYFYLTDQTTLGGQ
ncbi:MAG TPA: DUF4249 family protein [bacterium]|jgi:hypothetical protein